jgi:hypothetical protein
LFPSEFGVYLVTYSTLVLLKTVVGNKLEAARFPNSALLVAMVFEVPPFPISTGKHATFEVAHLECKKG